MNTKLHPFATTQGFHATYEEKVEMCASLETQGKVARCSQVRLTKQVIKSEGMIRGSIKTGKTTYRERCEQIK